jgi:glyoxylase-like metal-dependent hydrolase (beta-lactamase superfamily II)
MMPNYICVTCGNQYGESEEPPLHCLICEDERQYVGYMGQTWTTVGQMEGEYRNVIRPLEPGLWEIGTEPKFAIGQRALLVQGPGGNVLWDCVSHIDDATIEAIEALGGISALGMSHPHMFGSMVEWSHAFGRAPIYLHSSYERWVMRPDPVIEFWDRDSHRLDQGVSLYRCGGHFKGSTVLLWPDGAEGRGALLSSDTMYVTADRRYVAFMYSYPNYTPLSVTAVSAIVERIMPLKFDRIYSHFYHRQIFSDAKRAVQRSEERYRIAVSGERGAGRR